MKLRTAAIRPRSSRLDRRAAFTLAEVLVSLAFMAIVIPVALQGIHVASGAGELAPRKSEAAMVADRLLTQSVITGDWSSGVQSGTVRQGAHDYPWILQNVIWNEDVNQISIRQISVEVTYSAQGLQKTLQLSTLVDESQMQSNSMAAPF